MVTVKLFAQFRNGRFKTSEINAGLSVKEVLKSLGINENELGILMINSKHDKIETVLNSGDTLSLFPKVGGG